MTKKITYDYTTTVNMRKRLEREVATGIVDGHITISKNFAHHLIGVCKEHEHYEKQFQEQLLQEL